jgi:diguanylate cyclase (GGDEF)-like protein/PAS domain S-box-containing protein
MTGIPPLSSWSLKTKLALCSGALMLAFALAFTSWTLTTVESDLHASVVETQLELVRATAQDLDDRIGARRDAIAYLATMVSQSAPKSGADMNAFLAERWTARRFFDAVLVVDAAGRVLGALPEQAATAQSLPKLTEASFFRQLGSGASVVVSPPFKATPGAGPYVVFAAALRTHEGRPGGALLGLLNPAGNNFLGKLAHAHVGKDGYFVIVERNQHPLFVAHHETEIIGTPTPGGSSHPIMAEALQGHEGWQQGPSTPTLESLRTFKPLESVPWTLVAVYPTAEAFAGLHSRQKDVLVLGVGLFLLGSGAAWLMSGWLLRPMTRLRMKLSSQTAGQTAALVPEHFGSAELAALVRAYNAQASIRHEFEQRLETSERRMREVADNLTASIAHVDNQERYTFANARILSRRSSADVPVIGNSLRTVLGPREYAELAPYIRRALQGEHVTFEGQEMVDGQKRHVQTQFIPDRDPSGAVRGFYRMSFDITELKEAQSRQALVEQRLRAISDSLPAMIAHVDRDLRYDFLNATFLTWLGIDPVASAGRPMAEVIGADVYATRREHIARCMAGHWVSFEMEAQTLLGHKTLRIEYLPDTAPDGTVAGFYTLSSDVTELKEAQRSLSLLVRSDRLTGLSNRLQFEEELPIALERCKRQGMGLALMFIDVDHFKQINDSFGHGVGDQLLQEFALRLRRSVRSTDTVARLGGDEFVVILEGLRSRSDATLVAQNMVDDIRSPIDLGERLLQVTTSVGVAFLDAGSGEDKSASTMLAQADAALYAAKAAGRNGYHLAVGT